jgi:hypothetical protein
MTRLPAARAMAWVGGLAVVMALAACSGTELEAGAGLSCLDDSRECIDRRTDALKRLLADPGHTWVRQPATPAAYVSGVRLFAYKGRKQSLSCEDLAHGRREADAAPQVLSGAALSGLAPAQVSRSRMLAAEVSKELLAEQRKRCKV